MDPAFGHTNALIGQMKVGPFEIPDSQALRWILPVRNSENLAHGRVGELTEVVWQNTDWKKTFQARALPDEIQVLLTFATMRSIPALSNRTCKHPFCSKATTSIVSFRYIGRILCRLIKNG